MAVPAKLSPAEYFAIDEASDIKHELVDGDLYAMAGGTPEHAQISAAIIGALFGRLHRTPCRPFSSDLRVFVTHQTYAYPDVTIICGPVERLPENLNTATNPKVVFEVLSPSTEHYDRGLKLRQYTRIPSLSAVVLVSTDRPVVEVYERQGDQWVWSDYEGLDASARLISLDLELPLSEIFENALG